MSGLICTSCRQAFIGENSQAINPLEIRCILDAKKLEELLGPEKLIQL
jgi:hypothetical protein